MNKKLNAVLFIVLGTVFNLVLLAILGVLFVFLFDIVARVIAVSRTLAFFFMGFAFLASIGITFFLYSRVIKWATAKWDLNKYIEPIFLFTRQKK